jgi:hypothetical protein
LIAGTVNLALGLVLGGAIPQWLRLAGAVILGLLGTV